MQHLKFTYFPNDNWVKSLFMRFDRLKSLIDRSFYRNLMFIKGFQANIVRKICKLIVMVNTVRGLTPVSWHVITVIVTRWCVLLWPGRGECGPKANLPYNTRVRITVK